MDDEQQGQVTFGDLRSAVSNEVRQAMTSWRLGQEQDHEDIRLLKWTVYGNRDAGKEGLVEGMTAIRNTLDTLVKTGEQRQWLQKGIAIGIAVNIAQQAGLFEILARIAKVIP